MKCKVCNKDLFIDLDFRSLFKWNYKIHESCKKYLDLEIKIEVIPIENNTITVLYFFDESKSINSEYVEMFLIGKGLKYCIENREWSTVNWITMEEYYNLDAMSQYLFLKLHDQSIVFLKLFHNM